VDHHLQASVETLRTLGGIGAPAVQSLLAAHVDGDSQGRLQGVLASTASLATIAAPLVISMAYFASRQNFPGLVRVLGTAIDLICLPLLVRREMPRIS